MKLRIVHTLRADWLYGVSIKTSRVSSVLCLRQPPLESTPSIPQNHQ